MEEATKREILRLRRGGATYQEIGNLVGYGLKSIQKVIGENAPELAKMSIPRISIEKRRAIARAYYKEQMTIKEVKEKFGIGSRALNSIRLQFREQYGGNKKRNCRTYFTDEMLEQIKKDYQNGMSVRGLYEKYNICRSTLRKYGIISKNS